MFYPTLTETATSRDMLEQFGGYNHNIRINENEFYDMKNLTSSNYPLLAPRKQRGTYMLGQSAVTNATGLISKDTLAYASGTKLYVNGYEVNNLTLTNTPKQLISMGAYIIILPDKKYVNTKNLSEYGDIDATTQINCADTMVTYTMCRLDGTNYENIITSATEPPTPSNGTLWIDTSQTPHSLKQFSSTSALWTSIPTTYIKISATNIAASFKQYDGVKISGISSSITQLKDLNDQVSILWEAHHDADNPVNDYIVVIGLIDTTITQSTGTLTISRKMPAMDFVVESQNRLWGCRYGLNNDNKVVNEIYACKLGDFKNWECFMGISTDSYAVSVGTDGLFTGAVSYLGNPIFFKENCMHKVFGNYPSNYQIQSTACRGVMKGAGKSLAIVNETLFYKSRNGVCAYDGSLPSEISTTFGDIHYSAVDDNNLDFLRNGAVAGSFGNKYYISMLSEADNNWHLFVYDTTLGMWHKEDNLRVKDFCECRNELYYIDHTTGTIKTILGSGTKDTAPVEWMAETSIIGASLPDKKYVSKIILRLSMTIGATIRIYIQYDSCGDWESICSLNGTSIRSFSVPIKPQRCDHFKLRFIGVGEAKIFSISKTIEQGSDI